MIVDRVQGPVAYDAARLIGARVIHFKSPAMRNVVYPTSQETPA